MQPVDTKLTYPDTHTHTHTHTYTMQYRFYVCFSPPGKGKGKDAVVEHRRGAHLPFQGHWAHDDSYLWRMASTTPDLRLPSQLYSIITLWPVPIYTAWWTHTCVAQDRSWSGASGTWTCDQSVASWWHSSVVECQSLTGEHVMPDWQLMGDHLYG